MNSPFEPTDDLPTRRCTELEDIVPEQATVRPAQALSGNLGKDSFLEVRSGSLVASWWVLLGSVVFQLVSLQ